MTYNHILLDGDIIANKAAFSCQIVNYVVRLKDEQGEVIFRSKSKDAAEEFAKDLQYPVVVVKELDIKDISVGRYIVDTLIKDICDTLQCSTYTLYLGPDKTVKNFRHDIAKTAPYKGNRKKENRPIHLDELQQYLITEYGAIRATIGETDDMLGIDHCASNGTSIIASIDKDLMMLPGWHYNIDSKEIIFSDDPGTLELKTMPSGGKKLVGTGFKWFLAQLLLGDTTDNIIKPQKNLGPVAIFQAFSQKCTILDIYEYVKTIYINNNRDIEENSSLLWVLRDEKSSWKDVLNQLI